MCKVRTVCRSVAIKQIRYQFLHHDFRRHHTILIIPEILWEVKRETECRKIPSNHFGVVRVKVINNINILSYWKTSKPGIYSPEEW